MIGVRSLKWSRRVCLASLGLLLVATTVSAADLYRYRNDQGNLVINHTVPPQFAKNGYELIDSNGRVIERVEPQAVKTETEKGEAEEEDKAAALVLSSAQQERRDKYLLASFSFVEDIAAARERKLTQLAREVDIMTSNVEKIEGQRAAIEQEAAQFQRGGKDLPEALKQRLSDVDERRQKAYEALESRKTEYADRGKLYDDYAQRFRELKGLPPAPPAPEEPETDSATESAIESPSAPSVDE